MATTDLILQQYLDILEKTNQQLGLWSNPYGVMVAVLSFLVAVLAIVFAFYLWKQSRDYQKKFDNFLSKLQNNFDIEIKKNIKFRSNQNKKLKRMIGRKKQEMEQLTGDAKEKVEKEVKEIQEIKNSLNKQPMVPFLRHEYGDREYGDSVYGIINDENSNSIPVAVGSLGSSSVTGNKKCKKCGKFYFNSISSGLSLAYTVTGEDLSSREKSKCPYCGNIN